MVAMTQGETNIVKALKNIDDSLQKIARGTKPSEASIHALNAYINPAGETGVNIPVTLDWLTPPIRAVASFTFSTDGRTKIEINIQGEDAAIVQDLVSSQPVDALLLSSVTPSLDDFIN